MRSKQISYFSENFPARGIYFLAPSLPLDFALRARLLGAFRIFNCITFNDKDDDIELSIGVYDLHQYYYVN